MKVWYIWDFPDRIYIKLKKDYNIRLFHFLFKKFGGIRPAGRKFGLSQATIKGYYKQYFKKNNKIYDQYCPLYILKRFKPELSQDIIDEFEKNIEFIRVRHGSPIKINLPLKELPEMYRIVAHMIGDGCAGIRKVPIYVNTCTTLRKQFKRDLTAVFGAGIKNYIYETIPNSTPNVNFPKVLSDILKYIFQVKFSFPDKLPNTLFTTSDSNKIVFLRALFDDEGYASTAVGISMKSEKIIRQIQELLIKLEIKTTNISKKEGDLFTVNIREAEIEKFQKIVNFDHPFKRERLKLRMRIKERNKIMRTRPLEYTRNKILDLLRDKPMITFELCEILLLTVSGIYHHLDYLEEMKLIQRTGFKNKVTWKAMV